MGCLFTFWIVSFDEQMCLILIKSNLYIFSLVSCAFAVLFKKPFPNPESQQLTPTFS